MVSIVSFGGGVNSTAMIIGLLERKEVPDAILFADTGGEKPETYEFIMSFREWLRNNSPVGITVVAYSPLLESPLGVDFACSSKHSSLENECHNNGTLPSKAFGFGGCSQKWKRHPMDKFTEQYPKAIEAWARGEKVQRIIGIHAGENRRGKIPDDNKYTYRFALREWGWAQKECIETIKSKGLAVPEKSACFFCPSMKKHEVVQLSVKHPGLFKRAVEMEKNAKECDGLEVVKGLGRHWSWEKLDEAESQQMSILEFMDDQPPICDTCVDW
jgi:hypothetical protein